jgi:hypothetical protein
MVRSSLECPGGVRVLDPTGKLKFWLWEASEMIVSDFRLCHLFAGLEGFPRCGGSGAVPENDQPGSVERDLVRT